MKSVLILFDNVVTLYIWILIINAVISWLVAFNILNTGNRFVYSVLDFSYRLTAPALNYIRRFLPNLGSIDIRLICFTKTKYFQEWLNVKDTLALEIKNIVEKNKASFAFPSTSVYVEKN